MKVKTCLGRGAWMSALKVSLRAQIVAIVGISHHKSVGSERRALRNADLEASLVSNCKQTKRLRTSTAPSLNPHWKSLT